MLNPYGDVSVALREIAKSNQEIASAIRESGKAQREVAESITAWARRRWGPSNPPPPYRWASIIVPPLMNS